MLTAMVIVFLVGYLMIALEHPLKINKAGTALLIGTILWVMYTYAAPFFIPRASAEEFSLFLESFPSLGSLTFKEEKEETAGVDRRDHVLYVGRVGQPYDLDCHDHADP